MGEHYKQGLSSTPCMTHFLCSPRCLQLDRCFLCLSKPPSSQPEVLQIVCGWGKQLCLGKRGGAKSHLLPLPLALLTLWRWASSGLGQRCSRQGYDRGRGSVPRCLAVLCLLGSYCSIKTNLDSWNSCVERLHPYPRSWLTTSKETWFCRTCSGVVSHNPCPGGKNPKTYCDTFASPCPGVQRQHPRLWHRRKNQHSQNMSSSNNTVSTCSQQQ